MKYIWNDKNLRLFFQSGQKCNIEQRRFSCNRHKRTRYLLNKKIMITKCMHLFPYLVISLAFFFTTQCNILNRMVWFILWTIVYIYRCSFLTILACMYFIWVICNCGWAFPSMLLSPLHLKNIIYIFFVLYWVLPSPTTQALYHFNCQLWKGRGS